MDDAARPVRLIQVPYDSGRRDVRMGAGPLALSRAGAADRLREHGHEVHQRLIEAPPWRAEIKTAFELQRLVAIEAAEAHRAGQVPILLSGNCNTTVGMLAALTASDRRVGLVWFDAHGDFNTPETDTTGFLDGQGLSIVVGRCWSALAAGVPGFRPLPESRVLLVGARSMDAEEEAALRSSAVTWLSPRADVRHAVEALAEDVDILHIHVDLDVYDPSIAPANGYAAPDGLSAGELRQVVRQLADRIPVASATLASYDPSYDPHSRLADTALTLLTDLAHPPRS